MVGADGYASVVRESWDSVVEAGRGATLHAPGGSPDAVYVVARGAVEIVRPEKGKKGEKE